MHAAEASAKRAAFVVLEIGPLPHAETFGNGVTVITDDLEGVGILGGIPVAARPQSAKPVDQRLDHFLI
jgi:hypothetical protein